MPIHFVLPKKFTRAQIECRVDELALQFQGTKEKKLLAQIAALNRLLPGWMIATRILQTPEIGSSRRQALAVSRNASPARASDAGRSQIIRSIELTSWRSLTIFLLSRVTKSDRSKQSSQSVANY